MTNTTTTTTTTTTGRSATCLHLLKVGTIGHDWCGAPSVTRTGECLCSHHEWQRVNQPNIFYNW